MNKQENRELHLGWIKSLERRDKRKARQRKERIAAPFALVGLVMLCWYVCLAHPWAEAFWMMPVGVILLLPFLSYALEGNK